MQKITGCPKKMLRLEIKQALLSVDDFSLMEKSKNICLHLRTFLESDLFREHFKSLIIGAYAPMRDEVDWTSLEKSFSWAYPGFFENEMVFKKCQRSDLVLSKDFGVNLETPPHTSSDSLPHVLIIPGVAFTKSGGRLGRGKGFYDRYLEKFPGIKIGLCFNEQLRESIPLENHDIAMDYVVSENGVF